MGQLLEFAGELTDCPRPGRFLVTSHTREGSWSLRTCTLRTSPVAQEGSSPRKVPGRFALGKVPGHFRAARRIGTGVDRISPRSRATGVEPVVGRSEISRTRSSPAATRPNAGKPLVSGSVRPPASSSAKRPRQRKSSGITWPVSRRSRASERQRARVVQETRVVGRFEVGKKLGTRSQFGRSVR